MVDDFTSKNVTLEKTDGTAILENQFKVPYSKDFEA